MAPIAHILPTLRVKRSSAPSRLERVVDRGGSRRVHPPDDVLIPIRRDRVCRRRTSTNIVGSATTRRLHELYGG